MSQAGRVFRYKALHNYLDKYVGGSSPACPNVDKQAWTIGLKVWYSSTLPADASKLQRPHRLQFLYPCGSGNGCRSSFPTTIIMTLFNNGRMWMIFLCYRTSWHCWTRRIRLRETITIFQCFPRVLTAKNVRTVNAWSFINYSRCLTTAT